jgi:L-seryl-tRNA(Ser) seleniumtransferase
MSPLPQNQLLRQLPAITDLIGTSQAAQWLAHNPRSLVIRCLRQAVDQLRRQLLDPPATTDPETLIRPETALRLAGDLLARAVEPAIRHAINATGIILHTGLGRAVFPESAVDSMLGALKGYVTLAVDRSSGERAERDELLEPLLMELTGAEAATVVNNNAAATLLVLSALAAQREVLVSRGQLIEIGGSFRLPEVMSQSGAQLVEVGATNRTHLKDYASAITPQTAALMRVHPSNYRIIGFTHEVNTPDLAQLAHEHKLLFIDDLGAGALVDLTRFGLPHEPTVQESLKAGADLVLFSADKLIGAAQGGVVVGRRTLISRLRQHPLMRALRIDKTCAMILERTLLLFRDPDLLTARHPTYRMLVTPPEILERRAQSLARVLGAAIPHAIIHVTPSQAFLGSGSLPTQSLPSCAVTLQIPELTPQALAQQLRLDLHCVFARIERDTLLLDVLTVTDPQVPLIAQAAARARPTD